MRETTEETVWISASIFLPPPPKKTQNLSENSDQGRTIYYVTYFVYGKSLMILFLFQPPEHRWIRFPQKTPKDLVLASFYHFVIIQSIQMV